MSAILNRQAFLDRIETSVEEHAGAQASFVVLLVGIRGLHNFNVQLGYQTVDELLGRIPGLMRQKLPKANCIERIGDTCFAAIIPNVFATNLVELALERVANAVCGPFDIGERDVLLKANTAAAIYPAHAGNAPDLLVRAESALHTTRKQARKYHVYTASDTEHLYKQLEIEQSLRTAVQERTLELYYQPKIAIADRSICGCEALMRWDDPVHGRVSPEHFIPVAEQHGLIGTLTNWALQTAARELRNLPGRESHLPVAINVSPTTLFDPDLVFSIKTTLGIWNMPPQLLTLEITESVIMENPENCRAILASLKDLGVRISIDDFGTGFSSLAYFKNIPADKLKIDRSFVTRMTQSRSDSSIVQLIIDLAHRFDLKVVAEGVEDEPTLLALGAMGCDIAQGYYFSRAQPFGQLCAWMDQHQGNTS